MDGRLQVFTGTSHPQLAADIMQELGTPLGRALVGRWKNGETRVKLEENVRGSDIFIIQSLCDPVDHHLMELLLIIDAARRASAARITAVIPYYAYAKQEKKTSGREPIAAKLVANLIGAAGADRVLTVDLHAPAIEGFFDIPVDHLRATPLLARHCNRMCQESIVAVSPDAGGVARAEEFRVRTGSSLAIISKRHPGPDVTETLEMVGDVAGKTAIVVDDMISTAGTLTAAAELLRERGADCIHAAATHGIFAANALERIDRSPIDRLFVTDTIPLPATGPRDKIDVITVAPLLAEAIMRIHKDLSI
ncbi:MAG TPA: ribose-phosphate pyrophosphokinase, partial [Thermomicrobiales bacterium]|nr:ribose-phosphate pyrophosphokinase [Thermomicrobiales bacterium]